MAVLLCFLYFPATTWAQPLAPDTVRVYFLGGQSNMDGYGYNQDLPRDLRTENKDVWIFHGNPVSDDLPDGGLGLWVSLTPGLPPCDFHPRRAPSLRTAPPKTGPIPVPPLSADGSSPVASR